MIVVGILIPGGPATTSVLEIAGRAAATGARTEIVGVAALGPPGDRQLAQLAAAGVSHATVTRSGATGIEPADLELALRYLPDVRVIALVAPPAPLLATALAASAWSGAALVVVGPLDADAIAALDAAGSVDARSADAGAVSGVAAVAVAAAAAAPSAAGDSTAPIVLDPPAHDPDGAFAGVIAALAARLDAGEDPTHAWRSTLTTLAIDPA